jgi:hypothetical protein
LLAEYGVSDKQKVEQLLEVSRNSRKSPWDEYRDVLQPAGVDYMGYESAAEIVRQFEPSLLPGLLQTEAYTRALLPVGGYTPAQVDRLIEARKARQELLDQPHRGELFFIIDEAVIRRLVGGPEVMVSQLEKLLELAARENVTIQIVPFAVGAYDGQAGSFVHLELSDDSVLYLESRVEAIFQEDEIVAARYLEKFQEIEALATGEEEFRLMVTEAIAGIRS